MRVAHGLVGLIVLLNGWAVAIATAGNVTIATYNVQNYVATNRMTAEGYRLAYPKPEAEKAALRSVMGAVNADVWVLQEMGPEPYLLELQRDLKAQGHDYPHWAIARGPDKERHVAILSRRALSNVATLDLPFTYLGQPERVKRGVLRAAIPSGDATLTLFGIHLKSRHTDRPDDPESALRRVAEATAVRDAVLREFPDPSSARFVVLGDCNDNKTSKAVRFLQKRGATAIAVPVEARDSRGESWTFSYRTEDEYSRIDFILVSPPLRSAVTSGTAFVYDGPDVNVASDHRPVVLRLAE